MWDVPVPSHISKILFLFEFGAKRNTFSSLAVKPDSCFFFFNVSKRAVCPKLSKLLLSSYIYVLYFNNDKLMSEPLQDIGDC